MLSVHRLLEQFPRFELGPFPGRELDGFTGPRVSRFTGLAAGDREGAKAHQAHVVALPEGLDDILKGCFNHIANIAAAC